MFMYLRLTICLLTLGCGCFQYAASQGGEHPNSSDTFHNFNGKGTLQFLEKNSNIDCCTLSQPCQNGGNCSVGENGLTSCECPDDFTGPTCNLSCNRTTDVCPQGFAQILPGLGNCYHISTTEVGSFLEAQEYCQSLHSLSSLCEPVDPASFFIPLSMVVNQTEGHFWTGAFDGLTENSPLCVGTGKPIYADVLPTGNGPTNDCVEFVYRGLIESNPIEYRYTNCASNNRCVCEILNPCDIPSYPVLPVPRLQ